MFISTEKIGNIAGIAASIALAALLLVLLIRYFGEAYRAPGNSRFPLRAEHGTAKKKLGFGKIILLSFVAFVASRLFYLAVTAAYAWYRGDLSGYLADLASRWRRWDAYHYIGLMERWYVNEGDPRFHIVFYPLYPLLGRALYLLGVPSLTAAYLVSNLCLIGCGAAVYELTRMDLGHRAGCRALWFLMFCPVSFFFSAPFTESLFLLTTMCAVLFARKRRFVWAVVFGALSANCRSLGMATAIPIFWEMLRVLRQKTDDKRALLRGTLLCALKVLPVAIGLAAYLALNKQITGSAFTFLKYQSEHWGQEFGSVYNTLCYTVENAFNFYDAGYRTGTWIPQAVAILSCTALMCITWRKQHAGDAAYGLVYFYCAVAPTWLLSGCRYIGAMYTVYPMLACLTKKKWAFAAVLAIEAALGAYLAVQYIFVGSLM